MAVGKLEAAIWELQLREQGASRARNRRFVTLTESETLLWLQGPGHFGGHVEGGEMPTIDLTLILRLLRHM